MEYSDILKQLLESILRNFLCNLKNHYGVSKNVEIGCDKSNLHFSNLVL
jgi:hypothetical protein